MAIRMVLVPMSWPASTSTARMATPGSSGISSARPSVSWRSFSLRASRSAPQSAKASLANSEGWMVKPAKASSRVAPLTEVPTPGTRTSSRPSADRAISG
jgi:hypothetical protein